MMQLPFPIRPHVVYQKQHLVSVTAELRFNPLLRITAEMPVAFQERVRDEFPALGEDQVESLHLESGQRAPSLTRRTKAWTFKSADEGSQVTLSQSSLALTFEAYHDFDDLSTKFLTVLDSFVMSYNISSYTRLGLRYVNAFPKQLGAIQDLLRAELIGLRATDLDANVESTGTQSTIALGDEKIRILTSDATKSQRSGDAPDVPVFILDFDHYRDGTLHHHDVKAHLDNFHGRNDQLFRWAIKDELHYLMEPEER